MSSAEPSVLQTLCPYRNGRGAREKRLFCATASCDSLIRESFCVHVRMKALACTSQPKVAQGSSLNDQALLTWKCQDIVNVQGTIYINVCVCVHACVCEREILV
jgi:hypothetical protein